LLSFLYLANNPKIGSAGKAFKLPNMTEVYLMLEESLVTRHHCTYQPKSSSFLIVSSITYEQGVIKVIFTP